MTEQQKTDEELLEIIDKGNGEAYSKLTVQEKVRLCDIKLGEKK